MKVKVSLEALCDVPDDVDLEKLPDSIMRWGLGPEEAVSYTKVVVKELASEPTCSACGAVLTEILAYHNYAIEHGEGQDKWVKSLGDITYYCGNCTEELDVFGIEDILKQVDEL